MPEGHTLHRLARLHTEYFAGGPVRVCSPQGRFVDSIVVDGRYFDRATATGKHLFHHYEGGLAVHIHLGLYGFFDTHLVPQGQKVPAPVGQVRMRVGLGGGRRRGRRRGRLPTSGDRSPRTDPLRGDRRDGRGRGAWPAGPRPPRSGRRSRPGVGPDPAQQPDDRRVAHGPEGARRRGQRLPRRGAVPGGTRSLHSGRPDA